MVQYAHIKERTFQGLWEVCFVSLLRRIQENQSLSVRDLTESEDDIAITTKSFELELLTV